MTWATKYIGLEFREGDESGHPFKCWTIVHDILSEQCGLDIEPFADIKSWENSRIHEIVAAELARNDWIQVERKDVLAFDVALMWVVRRLRGNETVRTLSHFGIVVKPGRLLHLEKETRSVCVRFTDPMIAWRLHSFYRHRRLA